MSDQPNAGATSETAQTWKAIHTKHTPRHPNKANMEWWLRRPNDTRGPWGPKVSWHLSYRWGKTPKKNLTQETCPDRGSNPGPLRDKRACYHLLHSGGPSSTSILIISSHLHLSLPKISLPHICSLKLLCISGLFHTCYMSCPFQLPQCKIPKNVRWRIQWFNGPTLRSRQ